MNNDTQPITLAALANRPIWVGWRQETRDGRATKIPYNPRTGRRAASDDAQTWATHDEAARWSATQRANGVGIMLGPVDDAMVLCGVDGDSCRDRAIGDIAPWAQQIIDRLDSYAEVSPSGTGVKIFFTVASRDAAAVEALFGGKHGRSFKNGAGGDHPPAIEVYRGLRYFTVTNEAVGPTDELRRVSLADLEWLIREAGPKFAGEPNRGNGEDTSRSAKAFRAGAMLKAQGATYQQMRDALIGHEDPDIAEWARSKGLANGERELRRIFDKAPCAASVIDPRAPYDTARLFQSSLGAPFKHHRGAFYEWNGSAWPQASEDMLRSRLYAFLDQCQRKTAKGALCPVKPTTHMVSSVLDALRAAACLDEKIAAPAWLDGKQGPPPAEIIACANGLLHLPTRRLLPHTPRFFNYNALDFDYDPRAPEPRQFLAFLRQLWPDDLESIATLQEMFGYLLTADTSQQKAFMLVGPKRSGKGTIGRVLHRLIGPHNCCSPTLAELGEHFGREPLIGKSLAIISDAWLSGRADQQTIVERLLSITGEDSTTIGRKYLKAWTGTLPTRLMLISNELPKLADASGALAGRFILVMLTISFYGREDHALTGKRLTELPSILNWSLDGWDRLEERGHFQQPESARAEMEQLEDLASPIAAFLRDRCEVGPAYSADVTDVFKAWSEWCSAQGRDHPGTMQVFGRDLHAAVPGLKVVRPRQEGDRVRAYQGLKLKIPYEQRRSSDDRRYSDF